MAATSATRIHSSINNSAVLAVTMPRAHVRLLPLHPKTISFLSKLDGTSTLESVLNECGMQRDEVIETLAGMLWRGLLSTRS